MLFGFSEIIAGDVRFMYSSVLLMSLHSTEQNTNAYNLSYLFIFILNKMLWLSKKAVLQSDCQRVWATSEQRDLKRLTGRSG